MPFSLRGAPATFQRLMDRVLRRCEDCSAAYLDDVVIFSTTWEQHLHHLERVLGQNQQAGMTLNPAKCQWAREEAKYQGCQLGRGEVRLQVEKVEAIHSCPCPRTQKEVGSFLGLASWYRRFVPQFTTIAAPLTALTVKDQRNPVNWNKDCEAAFHALKACLGRSFPDRRALSLSESAGAGSVCCTLIVPVEQSSVQTVFPQTASRGPAVTQNFAHFPELC